MKYLQKVFVALSLLVFIQIIKADYLKEETFEIASSNNQNICKSQYNGTILPHATDCHKFYMCVHKKPQEYNCDPNFHFDANSRTCVAGADCTYPIGPPPSCVEGEIQAVDNDCYIFEACIKGQFQKINCPVNSYFHAAQGICVPLEYNAQFKCSCILPEHTVVANVDNCETYFVCRGKTALLVKCPLGQYYNSTLNTCLPDLDAICLMEPTHPSLIKETKENMEVDTVDSNTLCAQMGAQNIHFQPFAQSCNTFAICVNGRLYTQYCPQGFYYDSEKKYCLVDMDNKCPENEEQKDLNSFNYFVQTPKLPSPAVFKEQESSVLFSHKPTIFQNRIFSKFIKF